MTNSPYTLNGPKIGRISTAMSIALLMTLTGIAHAKDAKVPGDKFDLSHWKIQLPVDLSGDGKAEEIKVKKIKSYAHPDFFYLDENGGMVFMAPNKGSTTVNTTNTRSELRYMLRGKNTRIKTHEAKNQFALESHPHKKRFGSVGGRMDATLRVDAVSKNAGDPNKPPAYSVVVGQIHATKYKEPVLGFGWGNEPLKIAYKKWPGHETGSVYWAYERNLSRDNENRTDIIYPVFGYGWDDSRDPGDKGIALGEEFSYTVNVDGDIMHLVFENAAQGKVHHQINLANNVDAHGNIDEFDHPLGYLGEMLYFKAGAYNQCSTKVDPSFRYPGCPGTGDLKKDLADGNYTQVTFSKLTVGKPTSMSEDK